MAAAAAAVGAGGARPAAGPALHTRWAITDLGRMSETSLNERGQVAGTLEVRAGAYRLAHAALWEGGKTRDLGYLRSLGCRLDMPGASFATGINDAGVVVGQAYCEANAPDYYAFVAKDGKLVDLGSGGVYMNSWSGPRINDHGQIVVGREGSAFLWQNGRRRNLRSLPGRRFSEVVALNDQDAVVGNAYPREDVYQAFSGPAHAFLWRNGKVTDLGTLGERESNAIDVNDRGDVLGRAYTTTAGARLVRSRAFVWRAGKTAAVAGLGGKTIDPTDLNDRGEIVGSSSTGAGAAHAFLWRRGRTIDLGTLRGGTSSTAAAVNDKGQIVGTTDPTTRTSRAFLWQDGRMIGLGTLPGGRSSGATAINEHGQILGWSTTRTGVTHAVLWTRRTSS